ncbi:MAG: methyltransferase domain-containing protein [Trueperaceae bacterium]|nr:methyltransferase domain-containing protein [Trueperaceae bacterium]
MLLRTERMVHGGRALARDPDGRIVLVSGALPDETVAVEAEQRSGVLLGTVVEVVEASPDRVTPPLHPGLDLAFASYPAQLRIKAEVLADAARRSGVALPATTSEVRPSPRVWHYRSVIQPAVRHGRLGFRREGSDEVVEMDSDPTAMPAANETWSTLAAAELPRSVMEVAIRANDAGEALVGLIATAKAKTLLPLAHRLVQSGVRGVSLAAYDPRGRFRAGKERLAGAREIRQRYGRVELSVSATAFAQPNPSAASELYEAVTAMVPGGELACELFAGSGAIAMHVADRYREVVAVEVSSESVARGRRDAERHGIDNVRFERADARRFELPNADTLIVDPPRAGLAKPLRAAIDAAAATSLLYVSCDVATWARDAADLIARGWRLVEVRPFDFQPHTHHLELATTFER